MVKTDFLLFFLEKCHFFNFQVNAFAFIFGVFSKKAFNSFFIQWKKRQRATFSEQEWQQRDVTRDKM